MSPPRTPRLRRVSSGERSSTVAAAVRRCLGIMHWSSLGGPPGCHGPHGPSPLAGSPSPVSPFAAMPVAHQDPGTETTGSPPFHPSPLPPLSPPPRARTCGRYATWDWCTTWKTDQPAGPIQPFDFSCYECDGPVCAQGSATASGMYTEASTSTSFSGQSAGLFVFPFLPLSFLFHFSFIFRLLPFSSCFSFLFSLSLSLSLSLSSSSGLGWFL